MKTMRLNPGDRVRITQDAWDHDCETIVATKGSIGIVLSYEEYAVPYIRKWNVTEPRLCAEHLAWIKQWIEEGIQYPIRFEIVKPLSEDLRVHMQEQGERFFVDCKVGDIDILSIPFLEKTADSE